MPKYIWIVLFFGCNAILGQGQKDSIEVQLDTTSIVQKTISEPQIESFLKDPDFDYEIIKKTAPDWWIAFKNWLSNLFLRFFEFLFGIERAAGAFSTFLEFIPYILLGILIFILIKFFLNVNSRAIVYSKKNQSIVALTEEEHIIKNENIQQLIRQALDKQNYRLAVRYYYLYMLQLMSEKELIRWELQKTNEDYSKELQQNELRKPFANITRLYEYIWYGDFPIDRPKYEKAETSFLSLEKMLKNG